MPLIFEKYFDRPAGRARNNGKPGGPMVRFIAAVFRELGIDVEDETVLRAISRFADLRQHRRAVRQRGGRGGSGVDEAGLTSPLASLSDPGAEAGVWGTVGEALLRHR